MMGLFDKVKKALKSSKKEDDNYQHVAKDMANDVVASVGEIENFTDLDNMIHSSVKKIILNSDVVLGEDEESRFLDGIILDVDDIVIDGNGYAIDAKGKTRIFYCTGKNITIKNFTLKNGFASDKGGAIDNKGNLRIEKSEITSNVSKDSAGAIKNSGHLDVVESTLAGNSTEGTGGAIYNDFDAELSISTSIVSDNTARHGGAIYNNEGKLSILESTFIKNISDLGGAVFGINGELSISGSNFAENSGDKGSVIFNSNGEINMFKSTIENNIADISYSGGGTLYNTDGGFVNISDSKFTNNITKWGGIVLNVNGKIRITKSILDANIAKWGGVLYNGKGNLRISDSKLSRNIGQGNMGIIFHSEGNFKILNCDIFNNESSHANILNNDSLQVFNSNFNHNKSKYILINEEGNSNLSVVYGKFSDNDVEETLIYNAGKFCSIYDCAFETNVSQNNYTDMINDKNLTLKNLKIKGSGKTILNNGYILVKNSSKELLKKIQSGGKIEFNDEIIPRGQSFDFGYLDNKIHENESDEIILDEDICFENYERDYYEGGIELDGDNLVIDGDGHSIDARDKSRIFIISGKNITLKNITFKNGHVHKNYDNLLNNHGGAIRIIPGADLTIENCNFINNLSGEDGGAIYNGWGELTVSKSTFNENIAEEGNGGAISNVGELFILESQLNMNQSGENGGVIYNRGILCINDSTLNENKAKIGGVIYNEEGVLHIIGSTLNENNARGHDGRGGAIFNNAELTIIKSKLNSNYVWRRGGGAIFNKSYGTLTIVESTLNKNRAHHGGAINNWGELNIDESTFNENFAKESGPAICNMNNCNLHISKSTFISNRSESIGYGAIYGLSNQNDLTDCNIK